MATKKRRRRRTVLWVVSACCPSVWRQCWYLVSGCAAACSPYSRVRPSNLDMRSPLPRQSPSALYQLLEQLGATRGRVHGMYAPGQLGVALYLQDDASGAPLTRLYIDQNETLFDAGQVYRTARGSLVAPGAPGRCSAAQVELRRLYFSDAAGHAAGRAHCRSGNAGVFSVCVAASRTEAGRACPSKKGIHLFPAANGPPNALP